jgi:hypothetical protein
MSQDSFSRDNILVGLCDIPVHVEREIVGVHRSDSMIFSKDVSVELDGARVLKGVRSYYLETPQRFSFIFVFAVFLHFPREYPNEFCSDVVPGSRDVIQTPLH